MSGTADSRSRRQFLEATGGAAAATVFAGCLGDDGASENASGGNENTSDSGATKGTQRGPDEKGSNTLYLMTESVESLDPIAMADAGTGYVDQQIYNMLTNYPNGKPNPETSLATDFELSDDKKTYTFEMKDATFHDGSTLTAKDFVYSFERLAASSNSKRASVMLDSLGIDHQTTAKDGESSYESGSLAIEAPDEKTFEVTLSSPFHATLALLATAPFAAVPEGIVGDIEGYDGELSYEEFATERPVGTGPFRLDTWDQGTELKVTEFDKYHGDAPSVEAIHWQMISSTTTQYNYAIGKNVDMFEMPTSQYDPGKVSVRRGPDDLGRKFGTYGPLENDETVQYVSVPRIVTYYVGFNMKKVPKAVRQAFAYVTDQKQLMDEVFKGRGTAAHHMTPPSIYPGGAEAYEKHAKQEYPYGYNETEISEAKKVMKDAGYGPDNEFTVQWTQSEDSSVLSLAKLLRDQLQAAYIDLQIKQTDFSVLLERGRNGKLEAYVLATGAGWPAPDDQLSPLYPPRTDTSKSNPLSYTNWTAETGSAAKAATDAYETVLDNQEPSKRARRTRNEQYVAMEEANWEDVVLLNLYHETSERFAYDWVDVEPFGTIGQNTQMLDTVKLSKRG